MNSIWLSLFLFCSTIMPFTNSKTPLNPIPVNTPTTAIVQKPIEQTSAVITALSSKDQTTITTSTPATKLSAPMTAISQDAVSQPVPSVSSANDTPQGTDSGKECVNTNNCTNPNRPYFDLWGNEFDYMGNLISASTEAVDPISGQQNPYYTAPSDLPAGMGCGTLEKYMAQDEALFAAKPEMKQSGEWTRYQEAQIQYQQNCQ